MTREVKEAIVNLYDNFLHINSSGSCRPRERSINVEEAINGLKNILDSFIDYQWYNEMIKPEEDKEVVVRDSKGKEYDNHYWNGHRFYEYVGEDGYPSDIDIVIWRYKRANQTNLLTD